MIINVLLSVSFTALMGNFHPVLVHLPIGILLLAAVFQWLAGKEKYQSLQPAIGIALLIGMISAIAASATGYLLFTSGDYEEAAISKHQWLGIITAIVSIVAYYTHTKNHPFHRWLMIVLSLLIILTGHLGGSITHGADYLTKAFGAGNETGNVKNRKPIANIQEAKMYTDVIEPLLEAKCYSCHGPNKQKGKLRLDEPAFITKGGKDGKVMLAGNAGESAISLRVALPLDNEDHMPPKEKPQLSKQEIELLNWWINSGASFDKQIKSLEQPAKIKHILTSLQTGGPAEESPVMVIPEKAVAKANDAALQQLKDRGIAIFPVAKNSNYLSANFVAVENLTAKDFALLEPISQQLIWLKLGNTATSDDAMAAVGKLTALTYLSLERTLITDKSMAQLNALSGLQYLNLVGTKVTVAGLSNLTALKNMRQLFLYQTAVAGTDIAVVNKQFPKATIDTGGYKVPMLASDTTEAKAPVLKK